MSSCMNTSFLRTSELNENSSSLSNLKSKYYCETKSLVSQNKDEVPSNFLQQESNEDLENEDLGSHYVLKDKGINLRVSDPEQWLCVARLPITTTEENFLDLVSNFGRITSHYLIHSEKTGRFKGYGLVEYTNKASSIQAKHVLEGQDVHGHLLECDWLKSDKKETTSLHSKCLYIDQLPPNYHDMGEFRRLFSTVVNPPYCQIAIKNGVVQNWGLVEFQNEAEAEETLFQLNGIEIISGFPLRVQFCIPGVHAITIYMDFIQNPMNTFTEKKALLEEKPPNKVYEQYKALAKQNPYFVQNLDSIMVSSSKDVIEEESQEKSCSSYRFISSHQGDQSSVLNRLLQDILRKYPVELPSSKRNIKMSDPQLTDLLFKSYKARVQQREKQSRFEPYSPNNEFKKPYRATISSSLVPSHILPLPSQSIPPPSSYLQSSILWNQVFVPTSSLWTSNILGIPSSSSQSYY